MQLAQIEAFLTVAERRSVSEAAGVLYVTQPALTARLKKLERELGVALFVRTPRGMRSFQAAFPNVHLVVRTGHSEEVLELVLREQVHVGLVRDLPHAAITSRPLYEDEIVLVVHPGHRFAGEATIDVQELAGERLILFDRTSSYFVLTSAFFRDAGVVPRGVMELDNVDATKKMVEQGLGIAFLPYTAIRAELAAGTLEEVAIRGYEPVRRPIVAIRRRDAVVPEDLIDGLLAAITRDELER